MSTVAPVVTEVRKRGENYHVEGVVSGRKVTFEVHAKNVEGRSRGEVDKFLQRSLHTVAEATRTRE